jgi:hypothetical protein
MTLLKTYKTTYTATSVKDCLREFFFRARTTELEKMSLKESIKFLDDIKEIL